MNEHYPFVNPPLPYAYDALVPFIDEKTMKLHHDNHLQTYVDNLNHTLKDYPKYQNMSLTDLLAHIDALPAMIQTPVKNNAGGVYNHIFFFSTLSAPSETSLPLPLCEYIDTCFGSFHDFKMHFANAALSVFGSGYAWLLLTPDDRLQIAVTANQDTPVTLDACPLLALDVWEHAYYLKNYYRRKDYIDNWFAVIDWQQVNQNLINCLEYVR